MKWSHQASDSTFSSKHTGVVTPWTSSLWKNTCTTTLKKPDITHKLVNYRNLRDIDAELMSTGIKLDYYKDIALNILVHQFNTSLREALDKHVLVQS